LAAAKILQGCYARVLKTTIPERPIMNSGTVSRLLSQIPARTGRAQSGVLFRPEACGCAYPERLAQLSRFLSWLRPLDALTRDEQVALGLVASNGKPMQPDEDDADDADLETEAPAALFARSA
jgi:hypothetical protein